MKNEAAQPIVEVRNLKEYFNINMGMFRTKPLKAVDNVSFAIQPGETLGLVGESGCGKTTVGRTILHLYKPTGGEVLYKGRKIQTTASRSGSAVGLWAAARSATAFGIPAQNL